MIVEGAEEGLGKNIRVNESIHDAVDAMKSPDTMPGDAPQTITLLPPCLIFFLVNLGLFACPFSLQHHSQPSEPKTLNLDSLEYMTAWKSSPVQ
jgi:hypothetical protein